jgi:CTP:molybdopterin cytidylyltransferase MocA
MPSNPSLATQPVDAIVLAGSVNRIPLFPGARPGYKALVELHGKPLIAYVLDTLHQSAGIGRVLVVGAPEVQAYAAQWPRVEGVPDGHQLIRNAWRGLRAAGTDRVLFCNPDQPLLRPEMVEDFLARALTTDGDLVSSWVREENLGPYTEGEHKFAEFGDGRYAHGNLFLVNRDMPDLEHVRAKLDRIYQARKNNARFAWELGLDLFAHFLWAKLRGKLPSLEETLAIASRKFELKIVPVISPYPEIVLDIDEPEDFAAAARYLSEPGFGTSPSPARSPVERQHAAV